MPKEILKWKMTRQEKSEFSQIQLEDVGAQELIRQQTQYLGELQRRKLIIWEALFQKHNIPQEVRGQLVADADLGYIWVKGKVTEFQEKEITKRII